MTAALRVADVIRSCWESYNRAHRLPPHVLKAVRHILRCRTAALGGHIHRCDQCGSEVPVYNSCQTRHCPTCQTSAKEKWLDARLAEVLPVQYFHVVFTVPHMLNALIDANRKLLLGELFGVANWVLQRFAHDPQWRLEGQLGFLAILHTWTQRLQQHFHLHCIVPGGVWRAASQEWVPSRGQWLFRKESLCDAFRNRFLQRLCSLRKGGKLAYGGRAASLADDTAWQTLLASLAEQTWIVFPKPTPPDPTQALDYVARYTHKVAIGNSRIKALRDGRVTYSWRDRSEDNVEKTGTIPVAVFTRRFLVHILPDGFHKIRYFGWMAGVSRKAILAAIRKALHVEPPACPELVEGAKAPLAERILRQTGVDIALCPHCGKGHLQRTAQLIMPHRGQSP
ncbi:MAG: IS91 family transposase [Planctomycetes bacterium]|nr:IS91 family transposase [Planctomycetota bacterium]